MMKRSVVTVLLVLVVLLPAFNVAAQQDTPQDSYLKKWIGQRVNVQVSLGPSLVWIRGAVLKDATPEGLLIEHEGKEEFLERIRVVRIQRDR